MPPPRATPRSSHTATHPCDRISPRRIHDDDAAAGGVVEVAELLAAQAGRAAAVAKGVDVAADVAGYGV